MTSSSAHRYIPLYYIHIACHKIRYFNFFKESSIFAHVTHIKMGQHMVFWCVKPQKSAHSDLSRGNRGQKFGLILHHHLFFVYRSSEGSSESVQLRRLARDFTARKCKKYPDPMYWFKFSFKERIGYLLYSQATILARSSSRKDVKTSVRSTAVELLSVHSIACFVGPGALCLVHVLLWYF